MDFSSVIFTPQHQQSAAADLHQKINDGMAPFLGMEVSDRLIVEMQRAIQTAVKDWSQKYPVLNKHNIGFELKFENGKLTILPSLDFQKLLAGQIV